MFKVLLTGIDFGDQNSTVKIRSGAVFTVNTALFQVDGRIKKDAAATIQGNAVSFNNGILESAGLDAVLTGQYQGETGAMFLTGDSSYIELQSNVSLTETWTFEGQCVLRGHGESIDLGTHGTIFVSKKGSSLLIDNVIFQGVSGNKICCMDTSCTISLKNVAWYQDNTFSFTKGRMELLGNITLLGGFPFAYTSAQPLVINADSRLSLDQTMSLSFYPPIANRDLLHMTDQSAVLSLHGSSLFSSTTGLRLTKGTLIVDHKVNLYNAGAKSISQGFSFGDGVAADDLHIELMPGASIILKSGVLDYANVNL
jgi:hypothetical protein